LICLIIKEDMPIALFGHNAVVGIHKIFPTERSTIKLGKKNGVITRPTGFARITLALQLCWFQIINDAGEINNFLSMLSNELN
jgi:hypothetical protein